MFMNESVTNSLKEIKYIVFDFNGTLCDDSKIGWESCNHVLQEVYGLPVISYERFLDTFGTPWTEFYAKNGVDTGKIDFAIHQDCYQKISAGLILQRLKLRSGILEVLKFLKERGFVLGVLSSRNTVDLTKDLKLLGVDHFFEAIVGENHLYEDGIRAAKKSDVLISKLGVVNCSEVVYVGDMDQGLHVAKNAGFVSVIMNGGWQSRARLEKLDTEHLFDSYEEFKKIF